MKERYDSNKKKIRGWKRHKRKIDYWKSDVIDLDMDSIREHHRGWVKLWIYPFYHFEQHINPPNWYKKLLLEAMIDVYLSWHEKMKKEDKEFYLKIWFYEPEFMNSEIVVSYKEHIDTYKNTFDRHTTSKTFPVHPYESLKDKLDLFEWEARIHAEHYFEEDLKDDIETGWRTEAEVNGIIKNAYTTNKIESSEGEQTIYFLNVGDVWVGTLKKS